MKGVQKFCFCQLSMQIFWRRRCSRVVDLKLPSFYVDDLVTGHKTTQAASELHDKAKERLALGGFNLRKWLTSTAELKEKIQRRGLRDGAKLNDKTKSADES